MYGMRVVRRKGKLNNLKRISLEIFFITVSRYILKIKNKYTVNVFWHLDHKLIPRSETDCFDDIIGAAF